MQTIRGEETALGGLGVRPIGLNPCCAPPVPPGLLAADEPQFGHDRHESQDGEDFELGVRRPRRFACHVGRLYE